MNSWGLYQHIAWMCASRRLVATCGGALLSEAAAAVSGPCRSVSRIELAAWSRRVGVRCCLRPAVSGPCSAHFR